MIPLLEARQDERGLAKVWRMLSWTARDLHGWEDASLRSIEHARRAGDRREEIEVLAGLAESALQRGRTLNEAVRRCSDLLRQVEGNRRAEAFVRMDLAFFQAGGGDFDGARSTIEIATATLRDIRASVYLGPAVYVESRIEFLAGDAVAAERRVREGSAMLEE